MTSKVSLIAKVGSIPLLEKVARLLLESEDLAESLDVLDWLIEMAAETTEEEYLALLTNVSTSRVEVTVIQHSSELH